MSRRGAVLEVRLGAIHQRYLVAGVARVHKTHPPTVKINGNIVYTNKGPPDYIGTIHGGMSVVFDAKESVTKDTFRLERVPPHQGKDLEACLRLGGHAFLVIRTRAGEWALPWRAVSEGYWARAIKTMTPDDLNLIGTPIEQCDWLAAVRAWEE